jgi:hypothetical protein
VNENEEIDTTPLKEIKNKNNLSEKKCHHETNF